MEEKRKRKQKNETACSLGLSATSQQYFSLRTNQPPATSQQYSSFRTNQHQPSATSQPNKLKKHRKGSKYYVWNVVMEIKGLRSLRDEQAPGSFGLSATSQQYFSLRINQPPALFSQNKPSPTISHQPIEQAGQSNRLKITNYD
jgi:hypothetical protein